ncbi:hypothetical protein Bmayo_04675 (plasmid) [Borreliella mayonii]|uniref:Uncharacterized protein n=1 Tax=Borreliella mayonii TaxID=1674146 RepID=A0AAC9KVQ3_9SPIR|nr:hypothetical protein A7X70_05895 [Borreliella mayonii]APT00441.1 hypothetical protein Bmayo_04675 [Borreliella mayonii]
MRIIQEQINLLNLNNSNLVYYYKEIYIYLMKYIFLLKTSHYKIMGKLFLVKCFLKKARDKLKNFSKLKKIMFIDLKM